MSKVGAEVLVKFDGDDKGLQATSKRVSGEINGVGSKVGRIADGIKKGVAVASKAALAGAVAALAAISKITVAATKELAEYEQNVGGLSAVFGKHASVAAKTAKEAYKNMGVSASVYMGTINKMGSLFQGSGIKQTRALTLSQKAMQRTADVASVMGIDMDLALESITGAAKGNFTMMDNLGVAMNATTLEAYALEKGINFKWETASNAQKAELAMKMFMDKTSQYAGNFARESNETVSGSIGMLKASYQDFLTGLASGNAAMQKSTTKNLISSLSAVVKNVMPVVSNVLSAIGTALPSIGTAISRELPKIAKPLADGLAKALPLIAKALSKAIPVIVPILVPALVSAAVAIVTALVPELPGVLKALWDGIKVALATIIKNGDGGALAGALGVMFAAQVGPSLVGKLASGGFAKAVAGAVGGAIDKAAPAVEKSAAGLGKAAGTGLQSLVQGLGAVGSAILANIPQLIALGVAIAALGVIIGVFWATAGTAIKELVTLMVDQLIKLLPVLAQFLVSVLVPTINALAVAIIALVTKAVIPLANAIATKLLRALNIIIAGLVKLAAIFNGTFLKALTIITTAVTKMALIFSGTFLKALTIVTTAVTKLASIFGATLIGSINAAKSVVVAIGGAFTKMGNAGVRVLNAVRKAADATASAVERIVVAVIKLIDRIGKIRFPSINLPFADGGYVPKFAEGGYVPGYASGGRVTGRGTSTSDSIAARLSAGEFVMSAASVRRIGAANLAAMNNGKSVGRDAPLIGQIIVPEGADPMAFSQQIGARVRFA